jgi:hypothetical protein
VLGIAARVYGADIKVSAARSQVALDIQQATKNL